MHIYCYVVMCNFIISTFAINYDLSQVTKCTVTTAQHFISTATHVGYISLLAMFTFVLTTGRSISEKIIYFL